jgi:multidrug efflux pump subunit AcrA (membrane-fusion protein)
MKLNALAVSGLALSAFLIGVPRVDANGMPTTHSTAAEQAQTAGLNDQVSTTNSAADQQTNSNDAQYQASQQQYQNQLQQNQAAQQDYQDKSAQYAAQTTQYENLRARYAAERAAYHRGIWPDRFAHWTLDEASADLIGQRVEILDGAHVGTVRDVARTPGGRLEALYVKLDSGKEVWIDQADIRYDRGDGVVMTDLASNDLHQMADERL